MTQQGFPLSYMLICEAMARRHGTPLPHTLMLAEIGGWLFALNGHRDKAVAVNRDGVMGVDDLRPLGAAVFWNGWLAGLIDAGGGVFAAGNGANEDAMIEVLEADKEAAK